MTKLIRFSTLVLVLAAAACRARESQPDSATDTLSPRRAPAEAPATLPPPGSEPTAGALETAAPAPVAGEAPAPTATTPPVTGAAAPAAAPRPAPSDDAVALLRRVEQAAAGIRTLEADFVQSLEIPLLNQRQQSAGRLYQKRPDRFLMRFSQPAGDIMVADGRHFWIYYPSSDRTQVIRTSIAEGGAVDLQRQFVGDATRRFVPTLGPRETVDGHATQMLTLIPRGPSPYRILKIWVDTDNFLVRRFEITEENESVRRVELRGIRVNGPVADDLFAFTPPAGTQVFDQ